mgnify:CR=1 FL=1
MKVMVLLRPKHFHGVLSLPASTGRTDDEQPAGMGTDTLPLQVIIDRSLAGRGLWLDNGISLVGHHVGHDATHGYELPEGIVAILADGREEAVPHIVAHDLLAIDRGIGGIAIGGAPAAEVVGAPSMTNRLAARIFVTRFTKLTVFVSPLPFRLM